MASFRRVAVAAVFALAVGAAAPAGAEAPAPPAVDQAKVDAAVAKGSEWLRARVKEGLPPITNYSLNEIVLYALLHAGVDTGDPDLIRLVEAIRSKPPSRTYTCALRAMAFQLFDPAKLRADLVQCADFLVNNQGQTGQWGYGEPVQMPELPKVVFTPSSAPPKYVRTEAAGGGPARAAGEGASADKSGGASADAKDSDAGTGAGAGSTVRTGGGSHAGSTQTKKRPPRVQLARRRWGQPNDNSNTQYALLGLSACMAEGIFPPPDCIQRAEKWWQEQENDDGGWGYKNKGMTSTGNMTAGGVSSLSICLKGMGARVPFKDPIVQKGLQWLAAGLRFDQNPGGKAGAADYYWIYAVERAGAMAGTERFGNKAWYADGATWLLANQKPDGTWHGALDFGGEDKTDRILDTCWAILFLRRATQHIARRPFIVTGQ